MYNCVRKTELRVAVSGDRGQSREVEEWPLLLFAQLPSHGSLVTCHRARDHWIVN